MNLTKQHINRLYQFTRQHYVEHFDVQTELVDHLANGIELRWQENPDLSFEEALQLEFKQFGIFGFGDVVTEKRKFMNKRYRKLIWKFFKAYFTWPKVTVFILISIIVYGFLSFIPPINRVDTITVFYLTMTLIGFVLLYRNNRSKREHGHFLLEDIINKGGLLNILSVSFMQFPYLIFGHEIALTNQSVLMVISLITALYLLLMYIVYIVLPAKAREFLTKEYEEYQILNV